MKIHLQHIIDAALLLALCPLIAAAQPGRWAEPVNISNTPEGSMSPDMAIGYDGRIHVVWKDYSRLGGIIGDILYNYYDGSEWRTSVQISSIDTTYSSNPRIAVDAHGYPHVVWNHRAIFPDADIYYTTLTDTGWLEPINISEHPSTAYRPDIAVDSEDNIHVVWSDYLFWDYNIFHRIYNGEEWLPFEVVCYEQTAEDRPRIAVDSQDNLHLACVSGYDIVYFKHDGFSWSPMLNISNIDSFPSTKQCLALDLYDNPHIVWNQITQWGPLPVIEEIFYSYFDGENWSEPENITNLGLRTADWPQLAISSQNVMYLLFGLCSQFGDPYLNYSYFIDLSWTYPDTVLDEYLGGTSTIEIDNNDIVHACFSTGFNNTSNLAYTYYEVFNYFVPRIGHIPAIYISLHNYPNPFNQITQINYNITKESEGNLIIYNSYGQVIKILEDGFFPSGECSSCWNGTNQHGKEVSAGVYFIRLHMNGESLVRKMIFIK